jgi:hypothetical protein
MDGTPRQYFKEIKLEQRKAIKKAITSDEWAPTSESAPYSESVIALFNACSADLSFLNNLHHVQREVIIPKFAEVVVGTVSAYVDTMKQLCSKDLPIDDQEGSEAKLKTVPEQFIIRMNDIYAARMHVTHWINNLEEIPGFLDIPEEETIDCDFLEDIKKYDEVKLHKVRVFNDTNIYYL